MSKLVNDPSTRVGTIFEYTQMRTFVQGEILRIEPHITSRDHYYEVTKTETCRRPHKRKITKAEAQKIVRGLSYRTIRIAVDFNTRKAVSPSYEPTTDSYMDETGTTHTPATVTTPHVTFTIETPQPEPIKEKPVPKAKPAKVYTLDQLKHTATKTAHDNGHRLRRWTFLGNWGHTVCVACGGSVVADTIQNAHKQNVWGAVNAASCEDWRRRTQNGFTEQYKEAVGDIVESELEPAVSEVAEVATSVMASVTTEMVAPTPVPVYRVTVPGVVEAIEFNNLSDAQDFYDNHREKGWLVTFEEWSVNYGKFIEVTP